MIFEPPHPQMAECKNFATRVEKLKKVDLNFERMPMMNITINQLL